ncbi:MAG: VOC family protein [Geminicoccaceae bacterium]|nr:VOC family protein [Geminicoccaceae bacterium]MCB9944979.1 VOC family protein [Geminicoccaceae bacterium]
MLRGILETVLYVDDLAAAETFYAGVLGLEVDSRKEGLFIFFRLDQAMLLVFQRAAARESRGVPSHGTDGSGHACFKVPEAELAAWEQRLTRHGIAIEQRQAWPRGGRSFYFRDPDGNSLEIATPLIWGFPDCPQAGDNN